MGIPETREALMEADYVFDNEGYCRGCKQPIEWWITPKGNKMPMSVKEVKQAKFFAPVEKLIRIPHWTVCPNAEDFRRKK